MLSIVNLCTHVSMYANAEIIIDKKNVHKSTIISLTHCGMIVWCLLYILTYMHACNGISVRTFTYIHAQLTADKVWTLHAWCRDFDYNI